MAPWSDLELTRLRELREGGASVASIAAVLGRTPAAVRLKASRTGLAGEPGQPWTSEDVAMLEALYASGLSRSEIANKMGVQPRRVSHKARDIGVTGTWGTRTMPPSALTPTACPVCGVAFTPSQQSVRTCSRSCGQKLNLALNGHPKGMTGKTHNASTKRRIGDASREFWSEMDDAELEARRERGRHWGSQPSTANTHSRSKSGRRADLGGLFVRSAWEANYARWLNYRLACGDIQEWEYEPQRFDFPIKRGTTSYLPDFKVIRLDGSVEWHEVKGWMTQQGATALKRFAKYFPDETLVLVDGEVYKELAKTARALVANWE